MYYNTLMDSTKADGFTTAEDHAYRVIKQRILQGELAPSTKLSLRKIASEIGLSVSPVIKALRKLEQDGLVESKPHWGSRVVALNEKKADEIFALREAIECQAVRLLTGSLSPEQEESLRRLAEKMDGLRSSRTDAEKLSELHRQFHMRLVEMTGIELFRESLQRVHFFSVLQEAVHTGRKSYVLSSDWHSRIIDAIVAGDPDEAERVMRSHIVKVHSRERTEMI